METILPLQASLALAGLGGSFVFACVRPDRESWLRSSLTIACGAMASFWLTPAVCESYEWQSVHLQHAAAFSIGFLGMVFCKAVLALAGSPKFQAWVKNRLGIPDDQAKP